MIPPAMKHENRFDKSSHYVLLQRGWQAGSGIGTLVLLTHTLNLAEQGWYYAFLSVSTIYFVLDLGLSALLVQISAREFLGSVWGKDGLVVGENARRFHAFCRQMMNWYAWAALIYLLLIPFGSLFFRGNENELGYGWFIPWVLIVVATCANQFLLPWVSLIEGTGHIREAYLVRLVQSMSGTLFLWIALLSGAGLYVAAIVPFCGFVVSCIWIMSSKRELARQVLRADYLHFSWREEVVPLQWRMAVSWISGYLIVQIHVPLLFMTQGAHVAGQMGLSLTIVNMLALLAQSWVTSQLPMLTQLASQREWKRMDKDFFRAFRRSLLAYFAGAAALVLLRHMVAGTSYNERILPEPAFALLMLVGFAGHVASLLSWQVRAYRRDPFVLSSIVVAVLIVAGVVWAAPRYSYAGVVAVMVVVNFAVNLPWVIWLFRRDNRRWRSLESTTQA